MKKFILFSLFLILLHVSVSTPIDFTRLCNIDQKRPYDLNVLLGIPRDAENRFKTRIVLDRTSDNEVIWYIDQLPVVIDSKTYGYQLDPAVNQDLATAMNLLDAPFYMDVFPQDTLMHYVCGSNYIVNSSRLLLYGIVHHSNLDFCYTYNGVYHSPVQIPNASLRKIRIYQPAKYMLGLREYYSNGVILETAIPEIRAQLLSEISFYIHNISLINVPMYKHTLKVLIKDCEQLHPPPINDFTHVIEKKLFIYERYLCQFIQDTGYYNLMKRLGNTTVDTIENVLLERQYDFFTNTSLIVYTPAVRLVFELFDGGRREKMDVFSLPNNVNFSRITQRWGPLSISRNSKIEIDMIQYCNFGECYIQMINKIDGSSRTVNIWNDEKFILTQNGEWLNITIKSRNFAPYVETNRRWFLSLISCGKDPALESMFVLKRDSFMGIERVVERCP